MHGFASIPIPNDDLFPSKIERREEEVFLFQTTQITKQILYPFLLIFDHFIYFYSGPRVCNALTQRIWRGKICETGGLSTSLRFLSHNVEGRGRRNHFFTLYFSCYFIVSTSGHRMNCVTTSIALKDRKMKGGREKNEWWKKLSSCRKEEKENYKILKYLSFQLSLFLFSSSIHCDICSLYGQIVSLRIDLVEFSRLTIKHEVKRNRNEQTLSLSLFQMFISWRDLKTVNEKNRDWHDNLFPLYPSQRVKNEEREWIVRILVHHFSVSPRCLSHYDSWCYCPCHTLFLYYLLLLSVSLSLCVHHCLVVGKKSRQRERESHRQFHLSPISTFSLFINKNERVTRGSYTHQVK